VRASVIVLPLCLASAPAVIVGGATTRSAAHDLRVPLGLDLYVPTPAGNPITAQKADLGRQLFFERRLSADGRTSCATCHRPERSFTDGRVVSRGVFGRAGRRNVPSILNRAYGDFAFWDGRAASLEEQVRQAASGETDLGRPIEESVSTIAADTAYRRAFASAYGDDGVTAERIVLAVSTFVRAQLSGNSAYDRFVGGVPDAMTGEARRGLNLFTGAARCARCHAGPLLSDEEFHNTGVNWGKDPGRYAVTARPEDRGRFKTPSLRNVTLTAPYMHDGSLADLSAVVEFYVRGGSKNPQLDRDLRPLLLSASDQQALIAFLKALSSNR
jgi:cytochrome c peroxidase